jgi:hypothetical protein
MTKDELQRALECAERCRNIDGMYWWGDVVDSLKATLEAKDKPERCTPNCEVLLQKVVTQRTWVGLTDEEIAEVEDEYTVDYRIPAGSAWNFAKDIEAKLKEKNT